MCVCVPVLTKMHRGIIHNKLYENVGGRREESTGMYINQSCIMNLLDDNLLKFELYVRFDHTDIFAHIS